MPRITFVATTRLPASAEAVFDWHEAPGAFERLTPPWERVRVVRHEGGIRDGARVSLRVGPGPFALRWDLVHRDYDRGRSFTDLQVAGPFRYWKHVHRMIPQGPQASGQAASFSARTLGGGQGATSWLMASRYQERSPATRAACLPCCGQYRSR